MKGSTNISEPTNESIAEAKNFAKIREAHAMLCGVEKHTDSAKDIVMSTTFPLMFSNVKNAQSMSWHWLTWYNAWTRESSCVFLDQHALVAKND